MKHLAIAAGALLAVSAAQAQVYKCTEDGKVVFSDRPCVVDDKPIDIKPAAGNDPATARHLRDEQERRRFAEMDAKREGERVQREEEAAKKRRALNDAAYQAHREEHEKLRQNNLEERERYFAEHGDYGEIDWTLCGDRDMAYVMSQRDVRNHLRAPSTAKFPHAPVAAEFIGDCTWRVVGNMNARNGNNRYSASVEYSPADKTWRTYDVNIVPIR